MADGSFCYRQTQSTFLYIYNPKILIRIFNKIWDAPRFLRRTESLNLLLLLQEKSILTLFQRGYSFLAYLINYNS